MKFATKPESSISARQKLEDNMTVSKAYTELSTKVQQNMENATFEFGYDGSAYYIQNKTIRVGIGAFKEVIFHGYGHLIKNYIMPLEEVMKYKNYLVENLSFKDMINEIYYDSAGKSTDIFLLKGDRFESEYQLMLYASIVGML